MIAIINRGKEENQRIMFESKTWKIQRLLFVLSSVVE